MLNKLTLVAVALALMTSTASIAEDQAAGNAGGSGEKRAVKFEQFKQKRLEMLDKQRACVSAATNIESMKACRPKHGEGKRLRKTD